MQIEIIYINNKPIPLKKSRYIGKTKKEFFKMMPEYSERTLRYWLNVKYFEGLVAATDYTKRQKHLTPKQVWYLDDICNLDFWE